MIDLETIQRQKMWEKRLKRLIQIIYILNLSIFQFLHAPKYYEIYNNYDASEKESRATKKKYPDTKDMSTLVENQIPDVYIENPFPKKIRDKRYYAKIFGCR